MSAYLGGALDDQEPANKPTWMPEKTYPLPKFRTYGVPAPCCDQARIAKCVCVVCYVCPIHGRKCHGSHD